MEFTIFLTQRCNLACTYCYIDKRPQVLSFEMAEKMVDFIYIHSSPDSSVDIGFFGGEPLLEFGLMKKITRMIVEHKDFDSQRVVLRLVSNGTIFSNEIVDFLKEYQIGLGMSCDGLPFVHDRFRPFRDGTGSSTVVEKNLREALKWFPLMPVNAVFNAETVRLLPQTVDHLSRLGVKNIHLNPEVASVWQPEDCLILETVYAEIGKMYLQFYLDNDPHYISLIDTKITVLLRGGYQSDEKCSMGKGELAFAPSGNIYPCERLVGGDTGQHCIGHVEDVSFEPHRCHGMVGHIRHNTCHDCSLSEYCMHWCGCTNFFATGDYNQVNHFLCYSEKAAIAAALKVIEKTREVGISFPDHLQGTPLMSIIGEVVA